MYFDGGGVGFTPLDTSLYRITSTYPFKIEKTPV
jgi:hypothetical protein